LRRIAAIVVWIGLCLLLSQSMKTPERLITTGANATITVHQPDQSVLSVGQDSMVRVIAEQHVAYIDDGEMTIDVPPGVTTPWVVETFDARAIVPAKAKLRVAVRSSVEFEVYAGAVQIYERGAKPGTPARLLQRGGAYRMPINAMASVVAERRDRVRGAIGG
jgi:ferric-dicitrate binding protein FerR (iron transport regulator)